MVSKKVGMITGGIVLSHSLKKLGLKIGALVHPDISNNFAVMSIQLDKSFSDALEVIKPFLMPMDELNFFLHQLRNKTLLTEQPVAVFELLSLVFSTNYQWPDNSLREIIVKISDAAPELKEQPKYTEIDEYLIQKGL